MHHPHRQKLSRNNTGWNPVADWYNQLVGERGSDFHQHVVIPRTLELLNVKKGTRILDIGCGQGVLCRRLALLGAVCTGIDISDKLIKEAKIYPGQNIQYMVGDIRSYNTEHVNLYDAATCILAIQNIDPTLAVFLNCARMLKAKGTFIIVMTHPCFRIPRQSGWGWDEQRKLEYRRVDRYLTPLKIPIVTHPGKDAKTITWTFHRPLEHYVKDLGQAGFRVCALEEWSSHKTSQPGKRARGENMARTEIPLFLAIRAEKI